MTIPLLFDTLAKMERESEQHGDELIPFFCHRVIPVIAKHPLLESIRRQWINELNALNEQALQAEIQAQKECIAAYYEIKKALKNYSHGPGDLISQQMHRLDCLVDDNKYFRYPFSCDLYQEISELFRLLLKTGHVDLCRKFCNMGSHQVTVVTQEELRWFLTRERKNIEISPEQKKILYEQGERRFFPASVTATLNEHHIETCVLAESYNRACVTREAMNATNHHHPAVVWGYFEKALWCWNTPAFHLKREFERQKNLGEGAYNYFSFCIKAAWREIANAREFRSQLQPVVFTNLLFKQGIKTLTGAIATFFSKYPTEEAVQQSLQDDVIFELTFGNKDISQLINGSIGILVTIADNPPEYYYLKKFNTESKPLLFAKSLLYQHAAGGIVEIESDPSDSIAKRIKRIGLTGEIKAIFFGETERNRVSFKGSRVVMKRSEIKNFDVIIEQLNTTST